MSASRTVRRGRVDARRSVAVSLLLALVIVLAPGVGNAAEPDPTTTVVTASTAPSDDAGAEPGTPGGPEIASNTPSPRGEPAPPTVQRVADSAIAAVLLAVLAGGVVVAIWSARRRRAQQ